MCQGGEGGPIAVPGGNPRLDRCDGVSAAFFPEVGDEAEEGARNGMAVGTGGWQGPRRCAQRGGRSALETSCPGGCLLGHQLDSWGERAHRRALNTRACLLPRGRCLGACSHHQKALKLGGGNFPQNFLALKLPPRLLQASSRQLETSPKVSAVTHGARGTPAPSARPPGRTPTPTPAPLPALLQWSRCRPCPLRRGDSVCDALRPPPSPGPRPQRPPCR